MSITKVEIVEIKRVLIQILKKESFDHRQANIITSQYLDAELRGKKSHGLGKFCIEAQFYNIMKII